MWCSEDFGPGVSVRGVVREIRCSKVPAQASRAVRAGCGRLNSFRMVAAMEECSYSDVDVGP